MGYRCGARIARSTAKRQGALASRPVAPPSPGPERFRLVRTDVSPAPTRLADYRPSDFVIDSIEMNVSLDPARTIVRSTLNVRRRDGAPADAPLRLNGESLELISLKANGAAAQADSYDVEEKFLTIRGLPAAFILEIETACAPEKNTALSGLYLSSGMFCTQCEAEGFRRITYYLDRPDILSVFTVRIEAAKEAYPVLLANGDMIDAGDLGGGRHYATWRDPHPKPAYLFALVGGELVSVDDEFVTRSGRRVALKVFVQAKNSEKCAYTLDSLKRAMKWDEDTFGREYDLDTFMIVAVDHFNFGAMENKGLNIFNSAYVLASPETATDQDYENIESIVAHEYFHNWSGNRVTLRDWFQLCLKEGFTVFRDQEFSADMRDRAVQRIKDVRRLWSNQFPEDAGPLAHPPRPSEFVTIDNFYTATVYEKGAEVVRMLKTLLGPDKFRAASDLYFDRHDGDAATVEDFARAMEDASGIDLSQFRLWWSEAGTPHVDATLVSDGDGVGVALRQDAVPPRQIPIGYAIVGAESGRTLGQGLISLDAGAVDVRLDVAASGNERPLVSLNTGFSAPIVINVERSLSDRIALAKADPDPFNRWSTVDGLWRDICLADAGRRRDGIDAAAAYAGLRDALQGALANGDLAPAFVAQLLTAPSASDLMQGLDNLDPPSFADARQSVRRRIAVDLADSLAAAYECNRTPGAYDPSAADAGKRSLKNAALSLMVPAGRSALAAEQAAHAANMTDEAAAASILAQSTAPERDATLARFYERWREDSLVVNKWLAWRAMRPDANALSDVKSLLTHEAYDEATPNKVRALIGGFANLNLSAFHADDGAGYSFFVDQLLHIDGRNPQLAARLTSAFEIWRRLESRRGAMAKAALQRIADSTGVSSNLREMSARLIGA
ncbi:MAG: aminopeptidase N [Alphaproteobacteria bacterium]|nr:aminopeptidase N [Alphaproteobacteria bacterium]